MLKLFEQIFQHGSKQPARSYPDSLVNRAIERALDATDPRVRILSGHSKKMRAAVIHAIDHVLQIVDTLAPAVSMSHCDWNRQTIMSAMFSSDDSLQKFLARDAGCRDLVAANPSTAEMASALLLAEYSEKQIYGFDLIDDKTVSDAPLTVVSFDEHRLLGLATDENETRRLLKLRAFDYLLMLTLANITEIKELRKDLVARKRLLQAKLDILARSSGSLSSEPRAADKQDLQKKMLDVETELSGLGADDTVLKKHLDIIIETLGAAEQQLWLEQKILHIDNMHYLRSADHLQAQAVPVQMLRDAAGHKVAMQLVTLQPLKLQSAVVA